VRGWLRRFVPEYAPPADLEVIDPNGARIVPAAQDEPVKLVLVAGGGEQVSPNRGTITPLKPRPEPDAT
jgi:hypothetical protein